MSAPARAPPPVTAVVVTYQSAQTVGPALRALRCGHDAGLLDCVVVDNGSSDGTGELLAREASWATVLPTGRNHGFGRGCNIGAEQVASPYTLFVNPDAVVEPEVVRSLLDFLERRPEAGIAGPAIVQGDGEGPEILQVAGRRLTPGRQLLAAVPLLRLEPLALPILPGSAPRRAGWVCGAVLLIRTALLRRLRGFDPRFFLYWEEIDLCKRAEDAGSEVWAVGAAVARHVGGASAPPGGVRIAGCIARHYFQSRTYYMRKHHGWAEATAAELGEFLLLLAGSLADAVRGRALRLRPRLQARLLSEPERP